VGAYPDEPLTRRPVLPIRGTRLSPHPFYGRRPRESPGYLLGLSSRHLLIGRLRRRNCRRFDCFGPGPQCRPGARFAEDGRPCPTSELTGNEINEHARGSVPSPDIEHILSKKCPQMAGSVLVSNSAR
jgi:hypothetical protein